MTTFFIKRKSDGRYLVRDSEWTRDKSRRCHFDNLADALVSVEDPDEEDVVKQVWLWVADYGTAPNPRFRYNATLFFTSIAEFEKQLGRSAANQQLVPVEVDAEFDRLDYIPDNY